VIATDVADPSPMFAAKVEVSTNWTVPEASGSIIFLSAVTVVALSVTSWSLAALPSNTTPLDVDTVSTLVVTVLPVTVKSPAIVTLVGKPIVTLTSVPTLVTAVVISFEVPKNCKSSAAKLVDADPVSPSTVNSVDIFLFVTPVILPCASTTISGIAVAEP